MKFPARTRIGTALAALFFLIGDIPVCAGQTDSVNVHVTPRVVTKSSKPDASPGNGEGKAIQVDVDLVLVPVTVTDQMDRLVLGLEKEAFSVYDGNKLQVIRHLSTEDAPISVGLIFDTSSSMYGKIERARQAVVQFLRSANPEDEFFLIGFSNRPELLVDFTNSVDEIQSEISKATPDGGTALLDAVYFGLNKMKTARYERKALLIVSDGAENHSRYTIKDVWPVVKEATVQVYAMGIFDEAPRSRAERMGPDLLSAMTDITGGRTFPIRNLKRIGEVTDRLAIELRNQYLIAYRPSDLTHDGRWHKISVRVMPPEGYSRLRVYAKGGYYAPAE